MKKVSILYFANSAKKSTRTGLTPIYLRIGGNIPGGKTEANLDIYLTDKEVSQWNPILMRVDLADCHANKLLNKLDIKIEELKVKYYPDFSQLSPVQIKNELLNLDKAKYSPKEMLVLNYINKYFQEIVLPNSSFVKGTKKNYKKSMNHFSEFLTFYKLENIRLKDFSVKHALQFKDYLLNEITPINKSSMLEASAASIAKTLKVIFNRAVDEDILEKNPFKKVRFKFQHQQKPRLTPEEIFKIASYDLKENRSLEVYRDLFLFSIYTGLAYADSHDLKRNNITQTKDGYLLTTSRLKTKINVRQFLIEPAIELFKKYEDHLETQPFGHVFPQRALSKLNFYLKFIGTLCRIDKNLSSHVARHTCMQNLAESGIDDIQVRNTILGWSSNKLTSTTYYVVTDTRLFDAKTKLEIYLNQYLCPTI
jgi:integrase